MSGPPVVARPATRPWPVNAFTLLYLAAIALSMAVTVATWNDEIKDLSIVEARAFGALCVISLAIDAALAWYVLARRSRVARWIIVGLTVLTVPIMIFEPEYSQPWRAIGLGATLCTFVYTLLLFHRDFNSWLHTKPDLQETFE